MNETIGQRIKSARFNTGMTQKELAEKLGLPYQSVSQWERDERAPRLDTVIRIAQAMGVPSSYLLGIDCKTATLPDWPEMQEKKKERPPVECTQDAEERIGELLTKLNTTGQNVAVERVEELTKIPDYQK